jgi:hypothetical protein
MQKVPHSSRLFLFSSGVRQLFGPKKGIFKAVSPKLIIFVPYCIKARSVCQDQVGAKQSFMHSFVPPTSKTAEPFSRHWDQGVGAQSCELRTALSRRHRKRQSRFPGIGIKGLGRKAMIYTQFYPADIKNGFAVFGALGMFFSTFAKGDTKTYLNTSP